MYIVLIIMISLVALAYLFNILWIYNDCKKLGGSPVIWILLLFVTTPFVSTIIYLIYRKKTYGSYFSDSSKKELLKVIISYVMLIISCLGMVFYFYVDTNDTWPFNSAFAEYEYKNGNTLDYKFHKASKEYEKEFVFEISDTNSQELYYDVSM